MGKDVPEKKTIFHTDQKLDQHLVACSENNAFLLFSVTQSLDALASEMRNIQSLWKRYRYYIIHWVGSQGK